MRLCLVAAVLAALLVPAAHAAPPAQRLDTAVSPGLVLGWPGDGEIAARRIRDAGAGFVRVTVRWDVIAPSGDRRPTGFSASSPLDPQYRWDEVDAAVRNAVTAGLQPYLFVLGAPSWAVQPKVGSQDGPRSPDAGELAAFARAMASRYSGKRPGLPRVRYWQAWNEPNLTTYLAPQFEGERPVSPELYRRLLNAFALAVRGVHRDNLVIAGALSPFTVSNASYQSIGPLRFMRELFCLTKDNRPRPSCPVARFDVWGHHPYTSGGPTHSAVHPDDVSLGDLPEMKAVLDAAVRAGRIRSNGPVRFWVTEFSWDSAPSDPKGVPIPRLARWVSEALYRMSEAGVTLVTWQLLRDEIFGVDCEYCGFTQSGLWAASKRGVRFDTPKGITQAFRFPFVAFRSGSWVDVWGRTPDAKPRFVSVQGPDGRGGWRTFAHVQAGPGGIFRARLRWHGDRQASLRAAVGGERSVSFSLVPQPDIPVCPFGTC